MSITTLKALISLPQELVVGYKGVILFPYVMKSAIQKMSLFETLVMKCVFDTWDEVRLVK